MDSEDSQKTFYSVHFRFIQAAYQNDLIWLFMEVTFYRMWKNVQICLQQLEREIEDIRSELNPDSLNLHSLQSKCSARALLRIQCYAACTPKRALASIIIPPT